jgi:tripartite ATP-independent transporter DctM subunit
MGIADKLVLNRQRHLKWKALDNLEMILMIICGLTLFGFSMSVCADITTRIIGRPWLWLQEVTSTLFVYGIFIGAAVATRRNDHLYLTAVAESMHGKARLAAEVIIRLIVLVVAACLIYYGYLNFLRGFGSFRLPSNTPIASLYAAIPLSGILIALFTIEQIVNGCRNGFEHSNRRSRSIRLRSARPGRRAAMSAPVILALMTACFLTFGYLGVPVPFALLGGVFVGALLSDVSLAAIIQKVFDGVDNEALLAIPFFLLVGELMSSANVVVRIANLSMVLVGHIRGGLSQVVTVFSMFFSEMSGSTTADVAVMSRALAGPMKKEGYEGPFIAAIIAAASTIAALVPPSITAVVYGATGNVSIAGLFMAGFVPGLMIGFGLMTYCYFFGPVGFKRPRASFGMIALAARDAALPLMIPVILLGGILSGWFTPTEAGVVAALWIIVVIIPALNPRHIWNLPYDFCLAGLIFSLPLITIGAANAFGYLLAYLRGAIVISEWIIGIAGNDPHLIMLLMVLLFTIVGDFIEPVPTIIIFMPLVNALTTAGNINPACGIGAGYGSITSTGGVSAVSGATCSAADSNSPCRSRSSFGSIPTASGSPGAGGSATG